MQQSLPICSRATHVGSIMVEVECRYVAGRKALPRSSKLASDIGERHFINFATVARFQGVSEGIRHGFISLQLRPITSCSSNGFFPMKREFLGYFKFRKISSKYIKYIITENY